MSFPLRVNIPFVGPLLILTTLLLVGAIILFLRYVYQKNEAARSLGHKLLVASLVVQIAAIVALVLQMKSATPFGPCPAGSHFATKCYEPGQYEQFGAWLAEQQGLRPEQIKSLASSQLVGASEEFVQNNSARLALSTNANPVELAALITALAATLLRHHVQLPHGETARGAAVGREDRQLDVQDGERGVRGACDAADDGRGLG